MSSLVELGPVFLKKMQMRKVYDDNHNAIDRQRQIFYQKRSLAKMKYMYIFSMKCYVLHIYCTRLEYFRDAFISIVKHFPILWPYFYCREYHIYMQDFKSTLSKDAHKLILQFDHFL